MNFLFKNVLKLGEDEADDTADDDTSSVLRHKNRGPIVRLKKRDIPLYGFCPQTDPFSVVICRICRMVLKPQCLKSHIDRRHERERKHELGDAVVKLEKYCAPVDKLSFDKTSGVTEKFDKFSVLVERYDKIPATVQSFSSVVEKTEKHEKPPEPKRHRHFQRKSATPSENSNDAVHFEAPSQILATTESSSASNSPQPRKRKRKHVEEPVETFQNSVTSAPPTTCRIIVDPAEIVIRDASSPPPLAPITNESAPSVWIVTPSPAVIIDGSFVMKPLEQEIEPEVDLKDLKVLKPLIKETLPETPTLLTPSNWYASQPKPLAVNTFNMRKLNAQRYVMATQRKLIELGRNLRTEEKATSGKEPKTWSFIERGVSFIPFRVTH